ncbi:MAG: hypothetical protein WC514_00270 [Candidatus Paceibacterota bacterium]
MSEVTIISCPACGSSDLGRMTPEEIERVLSENEKVTAFFLKWPSNNFWQGIDSRQKLEAHQKKSTR